MSEFIDIPTLKPIELSSPYASRTKHGNIRENKVNEWKFKDLVNKDQVKDFLTQFSDYFWIYSSFSDKNGARIYTDYDLRFDDDLEFINSVEVIENPNMTFNTYNNVCLGEDYRNSNLIRKVLDNQKMYIYPGDQLGVEFPVLRYFSRLHKDVVEEDLVSGLDRILRAQKVQVENGRPVIFPVFTDGGVQNYLDCPWIELSQFDVHKSDMAKFSRSGAIDNMRESMFALRNELARQYGLKGLK